MSVNLGQPSPGQNRAAAERTLRRPLSEDFAGEAAGALIVIYETLVAGPAIIGVIALTITLTSVTVPLPALHSPRSGSRELQTDVASLAPDLEGELVVPESSLVWRSHRRGPTPPPFSLISLCPIFLEVIPISRSSTPNQPTSHSQSAVATLPISRYAMHQAEQSKTKQCIHATSSPISAQRCATPA